jgi:hypothetical protein
MAETCGVDMQSIIIKNIEKLLQIIFVEIGIRKVCQFLQTCALLDCTVDQKMQTAVFNSKYV